MSTSLLFILGYVLRGEIIILRGVLLFKAFDINYYKKILRKVVQVHIQSKLPDFCFNIAFMITSKKGQFISWLLVNCIFLANS